MDKITLNNRMCSYGRCHMNLIVVTHDDDDVVLYFAGKTIPGVARVVSRGVEKSGLSSFTSWGVKLAEGARAVVLSRDPEKGAFVTSTSWAAALEEIQGKLGGVSATAAKAFMRARMPNTSGRLDANAARRRGRNQRDQRELIDGQMSSSVLSTCTFSSMMF